MEVDIQTDYFGKVELKWFTLLVIANAFFGLILFEWAWYYTYVVRNHPKELNAIFPMYRREDARRWNKCKFYPGALTLLLPRLIWINCCVVALIGCIKLTLIGHDRDRPMGNFRRHVMIFWYKLYAHLIMFFGVFTVMTHKRLSHEEVGWYEEYLGKQPHARMTVRNELGEVVEADSGLFISNDAECVTRVPKRGPGRAAIVVCNHIGFCEIMNLITSPLTPGFTPKKDYENAPFMGALCGGLQSLFLNRSGTKEERDSVVKQITDRQEAIEVHQENW